MFEDSYLALITAKSTGVKTVGVYDEYSPNTHLLKENCNYLEKGKSLKELIKVVEVL